MDKPSDFPRRFLLVLIASALVVLIWAVVWKPFWGLEYEDAFVYTDSASFMLHHYPWAVDLFKTKSILAGSLTNVQAFGTFGGHSEAFPLLIASVRLLTGLAAAPALMINAVLSTILLVVISIRLAQVNQKAILPIVLLWLGAPTLVLYQTTGFAEVLSSLFVMIFLWAVETAYLQCPGISRRMSILSIACFTAALATKRENLLLLVAFPLVFMLVPDVRRRFAFLIPALFATGIAACYAIFFNLMGVEANEAGAIGVSTFSWGHFQLNAPALGDALLRPDFWGGLGWVVLLSPLMSKYPGMERSYRFYAILFAMYFFLYSMHYRSVFQVRDGAVSEIEMLRYSVNMFPCAVGMLSTIAVTGFLTSSMFKRLACLLVPLFVLQGLKVREQFYSLEQGTRFLPIARGLAVIREGEPIVLDTPMCARLIAPSSQDIRETRYFFKNLANNPSAAQRTFILVQDREGGQRSGRISENLTFRETVLEETDSFRVSRFEKQAP